MIRPSYAAPLLYYSSCLYTRYIYFIPCLQLIGPVYRALVCVVVVEGMETVADGCPCLGGLLLPYNLTFLIYVSCYS